MTKLRLCCEGMEVDERNKVAADGTRTYSAARN